MYPLQVVMLRPRFEQVPVGVDDHEAVAQLGHGGGRPQAERAPGAVEDHGTDGRIVRGELLGQLDLAAMARKIWSSAGAESRPNPNTTTSARAARRMTLLVEKKMTRLCANAARVRHT
jgi:hypothetical protein